MKLICLTGTSCHGPTIKMSANLCFSRSTANRHVDGSLLWKTFSPLWRIFGGKVVEFGGKMEFGGKITRWAPEGLELSRNLKLIKDLFGKRWIGCSDTIPLSADDFVIKSAFGEFTEIFSGVISPTGAFLISRLPELFVKISGLRW